MARNFFLLIRCIECSKSIEFKFLLRFWQSRSAFQVRPSDLFKSQPFKSSWQSRYCSSQLARRPSSQPFESAFQVNCWVSPWVKPAPTCYTGLWFRPLILTFKLIFQGSLSSRPSCQPFNLVIKFNRSSRSFKSTFQVSLFQFNFQSTSRQLQDNVKSISSQFKSIQVNLKSI